jgi:ATP-dependent Lhr-like helicase
LEQKLFAGIVPSDKTILIEVYDEPDYRNIIVHSLFGRRVNAALSRAYAYIVGRELGLNVRITVTDNGFMLTIPGHPDADWKRLFLRLKPNEIDDILRKVLRRTEMLKRRFRHCAVRSFMILRKYRGHEKSLSRIQVNAEELLKALEEIPGFPVLKETYREILEDYMHIDAAREVLSRVHNGNISVDVIGPNSVPSPFSHGIVVHGYSDIVLMEDMRRLLAALHDRVISFLRRKGSL